MKVKSRYALLAALGVSVAAMSVSAPAYAKKKEEPAAAAPKMSDDVRKPLIAAQEALTKKDYAAAQASVNAAKAVAKTADDQYYVAQFDLNIAIATNNDAQKATALDAMLATGKVLDVDKPKLYGFQGHFAYDAKNYVKAEQAYLAAVAAGSTDQDVYARLADTQSRNGRPNDALATLQKVIQQKQAAGTPVPTEWYARGADIASRTKLTPQFVDITANWLTVYPVKQNWHDSLFIYRQLANLTGDADLDLLRLARAAGVLPLAVQSAYLDYALAVYLRFPNEAVVVLNEGIKAGKLNPATSQNTREILALSQPKIAGDKASLANGVAAANSPKSTYKSALATADAFYGYGEFQKAAEVYKIALTKTGADASVVNVRLGAALAQGGDKDGAKAAFATVTTGPEAPIARYWTTWLDHPAAS